jgi:hypothetical protein
MVAMIYTGTLPPAMANKHAGGIDNPRQQDENESEDQKFHAPSPSGPRAGSGRARGSGIGDGVGCRSGVSAGRYARGGGALRTSAVSCPFRLAGPYPNARRRM